MVRMMENIDNIEHFELPKEISDLFSYLESKEFANSSNENKLSYVAKLYSIDVPGVVCSSSCYGLTANQIKLLEPVFKIEKEISMTLIHAYHHSQGTEFGEYIYHLKELRSLVAQYFLEHYKTLDRMDIYSNLSNLYKDSFFNSIDDYYKVKHIAFDSVLHTLLANLYIYLDDMPNFLASAMNASFRYGVFAEKLNSVSYDEMGDYLTQFTQYTMSQKSRKRWGDKVDQQKQRYLQHYKEKGFNTYKACALWIWKNDNPENLDFDTIKNHLSKADKEQAKQKQNKIEKK